jgi:hypothetical protein
MDTTELYRRMRAQRDVDDCETAHVRAFQCVAFLMKDPFDTTEIPLRVEGCLDAHSLAEAYDLVFDLVASDDRVLLNWFAREIAPSATC